MGQCFSAREKFNSKFIPQALHTLIEWRVRNPPLRACPPLPADRHMHAPAPENTDHDRKLREEREWLQRLMDS